MSASNATVWAAAGINFAGLTLVAGLTGLVLTNQFAVAEKLGQQSTAIGTLISTTSDIQKQSMALSDRAKEIERRIQVSQMDVGSLMAKAGIPVGADMTFERIGEQVVAFPQTPEAEQKLKDRDFQPVQFTPSIGGFVADAATASIVKGVVDNALGTVETRTP